MLIHSSFYFYLFLIILKSVDHFMLSKLGGHCPNEKSNVCLILIWNFLVQMVTVMQYRVSTKSLYNFKILIKSVKMVTKCKYWSFLQNKDFQNSIWFLQPVSLSITVFKVRPVRWWKENKPPHMIIRPETFLLSGYSSYGFVFAVLLRQTIWDSVANPEPTDFYLQISTIML